MIRLSAENVKPERYLGITIAQFETACAAGTATTKTIAKLVMFIIKMRLSRREKEFLGSCAHQDVIQLVEADGQPLAIAINGNVIDHEDQLRQTEYLEAFMRLCKRGYFSGIGNGAFRLTVTGIKKSRQLSRQGWKAETTHSR